MKIIKANANIYRFCFIYYKDIEVAERVGVFHFRMRDSGGRFVEYTCGSRNLTIMLLKLNRQRIWHNN